MLKKCPDKFFLITGAVEQEWQIVNLAKLVGQGSVNDLVVVYHLPVNISSIPLDGLLIFSLGYIN